tara:strand:- start:361 stop:618 length:258 start_codon:yes stop_codon:yes gene_type:complete
MSRIDQPQTDEEWDAHYDANTLKDAGVINADPDRKQRAETAAGKMIKEKKDEVKSLMAIAGKRSLKKDRPKGPGGKVNLTYPSMK